MFDSVFGSLLGFLSSLLPLVKFVLVIFLLWLFKKIYTFLRSPWIVQKPKFYNPKRYLIFGRPGEGKTTLMTYDMIKAMREGHICISNVKLKWHGYTDVIIPFYYKFNDFIKKLFTSKIYTKRINSVISFYDEIIEENQKKLEDLKDPVTGLRKYDETILRKNIFDYSEKKSFVESFIKRINDGYIKYTHYPTSNYIFENDLEQAIEKVITMSIEDPSRKFFLAFDEGFSYLDHSRKVPPFITNFINQSRKLQCTIAIASQRPVAVYPAFRALTDFMVMVENIKQKGVKYTSKKYYADFNESALPDIGSMEKEKKFFGLVEINKGFDKGELYTDFKGEEVYYYFDTRQSFALDSLLEEHKKGKI